MRRGIAIMALGAAAALIPSAGASEKSVVRTAAPPAKSSPGTAREPINASVSYTLNLPLADGALLVDAANNRAYKRSLYQKAASECEDLLATIAKSCQITNIGVSTNENRYAGQPATLYVSVNVNMLVTPK